MQRVRRTTTIPQTRTITECRVYGRLMPCPHLVPNSDGPLVVETPLEALQRRVRYAAAHPLKDE